MLEHEFLNLMLIGGISLVVIPLAVLEMFGGKRGIGILWMGSTLFSVNLGVMMIIFSLFPSLFK